MFRLFYMPHTYLYLHPYLSITSKRITVSFFPPQLLTLQVLRPRALAQHVTEAQKRDRETIDQRSFDL